MAKRTPEEIQAQREEWLARKAAREAGEDVDIQPPLKPDEEPPEPEEPQRSSEPEAAQPSPEPEAQAAQPPSAPEPEAAQPPAEELAEVAKPQTPNRKRTPEEIAAQREAFLAARAAKAAGKATETPAPTPAAPAPAPEKPAEPAQAATPKPTPAARPKPRPAPARKTAPPPPPEPTGPVTRREFLNYAWLASLALFTAETIGISLWFAFPNFLAGQFGGEFPIGQAADVLPEVNSGPVPFSEGKFWLVNVDQEVNGETRKGVLALFKVCTHLGCLYEWVDVTFRFECPCHGSKFQLTGDYIAGPARRSLDRFVIQAISPDGSVKESSNGEPLMVNPDDRLVVDTGARILGSSDIVPA